VNVTLHFVAQDVKLGSRFGPQLVLRLTGLIRSDTGGSESCCHIQLVFTWYMIISVKSYWRPVTEIFRCFCHFPVSDDETMH